MGLGVVAVSYLEPALFSHDTPSLIPGFLGREIPGMWLDSGRTQSAGEIVTEKKTLAPWPVVPR